MQVVTKPAASSAQPTVPVIALAGNPNAGKTTLFNYLTGLLQKVANYPRRHCRMEFQHLARRLGHAIELVIRPPGFDRQIGVAFLASFAAREVLVSTPGIAYNVGKDADEESKHRPALFEKPKVLTAPLCGRG